MTQEELNQLLELYSMLGSSPGKTASQRLNFLQDAGIDPFSRPRQFFEEEFAGTPEPELINPVAATYGKKGSPWVSVFAAIDAGADPDQAVDDAITAGTLNKRGYGDDRSNPFEIARDYAMKEAETMQALSEWARTNQIERDKFMAKQDRLRSEFEADQPYTIQDLMGQSAYEAAGAPTVEDVVADRQRRRLEKDRRRGQMVPSGGFVGSPGSGRVGQKMVLKQTADPLAKSEAAQKAYLEVVGKRLEGLKQQRVPTARGEEAMRNLAMMRLFGS